MNSRRARIVSIGIAGGISILIWTTGFHTGDNGDLSSPKSPFTNPLSLRKAPPPASAPPVPPPATTARRTSFPTPDDLPPDSPTSFDPVERAAAAGTLLGSEFAPAGTTGTWSRVRLMQTRAQPRPVRIVEIWRRNSTGTLQCVNREMFLADQLMIEKSPDTSLATLRRELAIHGITIQSASGNIVVARLPTATLRAVPEALVSVIADSRFAIRVEPDGVGFGGSVPNDPRFISQWGLNNSPSSTGEVGADVGAIKFWEIVPNVQGKMVAVLDSGLNFSHPDLENVAWTNPLEISGDGRDNDLNGRVDDVRGWDFVNSDNDPSDDLAHGTHVTGIICATRNNGIGMAGLAAGTRILTCKILNSANSGTTSNLIAALAYARQLGAPVMNLSLQNYPFSAALSEEIAECEAAGIVLSICAGNQGRDNDEAPNYPSSYPHGNIIAVGNHDSLDRRWSGSFNPSNYGADSVDLFAPGREIDSTVLGNGYSLFTGTSMSTPFVTAVCVALKYRHSAWTSAEIKTRVLDSAIRRANYAGICVSGGRLSASLAVMDPFVDKNGPQIKVSRSVRQLRKGRFKLKGTATDVSAVSVVQVAVGKKNFVSAEGGKRWTFVGRYKKTKYTVIKIQAFDVYRNRSTLTTRIASRR